MGGKGRCRNVNAVEVKWIKCTKCGSTKPDSEYYINAGKHRPPCKKCQSSYNAAKQREKRLQNPEIRVLDSKRHAEWVKRQSDAITDWHILEQFKRRIKRGEIVTPEMISERRESITIKRIAIHLSKKMLEWVRENPQGQTEYNHEYYKRIDEAKAIFAKEHRDEIENLRAKMNTQKKCSQCRETKPIEEFESNGGGIKRSACKACRAAARKEAKAKMTPEMREQKTKDRLLKKYGIKESSESAVSTAQQPNEIRLFFEALLKEERHRIKELEAEIYSLKQKDGYNKSYVSKLHEYIQNKYGEVINPKTIWQQ